MKLDYLLQDWLGTTNMVTASYVLTIAVNCLLGLYFILWFFKQPIYEELLDNSVVVLVYAWMFLICNVGLIAQLADHPEGYYPIMFNVQAIGVGCLAFIGLTYYLGIGIITLRDKIPGRK